MKNAGRSERRPREGPTSVERWTIERIDRDAGMVRVESVPMLSDRITGELLDSLAERGPREGADHLELWDDRRVSVRRISIKMLIKRLGLRVDEEDRLSENMVFWVVRRTDKAGYERVFHATQAARQMAKELYKRVARTGEEQP